MTKQKFTSYAFYKLLDFIRISTNFLSNVKTGIERKNTETLEYYKTTQ